MHFAGARFEINGHREVPITYRTDEFMRTLRAVSVAAYSYDRRPQALSGSR
jgi:hypothetical protein